MKPTIFITNLTKYYGKFLAVDNLSLAVKKGEILGFVGLNGAGKTTTIKMLLGLIAPTAGECFLLGKKVSAGNTRIWRDVGYIVEKPYAYPELTVKENLEIVSKLRGIKARGAVDRVIKELNLAGYASKKAGHLSEGNNQRLGLAKAIIHRPAILLLDEPTNGLDPAGVVQVRQLLLDLAVSFSVTVLLSSHQLDELSRIATNLVIIHEGKLIKQIEGKELEGKLKKTLVLDGKNPAAMQSILCEAGYSPRLLKNNQETRLIVPDEMAINNPDRIAALLVKAGHSPTFLKVEQESWEKYFLRIITETGMGENG